MLATARQMLLAVGLLAAAAPAYAQAAPAAVDVSGWSAVGYHDYVVSGGQPVTAAFDAYFDAMGTGDLDRTYYARQDLQRAVQAAIADLQSLPPYLGDATLRDTELARYAFYQVALADALPRLEVMIANGDLTGADALIAQISSDETRYDDLVLASEAAFASRWGFTLTGGTSYVAADTSYAAETSYATDSTYTYEEPEVYVEEDEPKYVSFWGALDRGLQDDMKGWSLGYDSVVAPKLTSGLSWRHQDFGASTHDRVELVVSPTIVSTAGEELSFALNARAGAGYAWGDGQKGWGASVGGEAELGLPGPLYAFVRADRGFWSGDLKDEYRGWEAQAGVGATVKI